MSAPPHDLEAEQMVLGGMMLGRPAAAELFRVVSVEDFYSDAHRAIAGAVARQLAEADAPTDPVALWGLVGGNGARGLVGGSAYLHTCYQAVTTIDAALWHARRVARLAASRALLEAAARATQAIREGAPSEIAAQRLRDELSLVPHAEGPRLPPMFVDWSSFWLTDRREPEWLFDDVFARGRGHSIYASHKAGKSLLVLWCALQLVQVGVDVIYLDYEMTEDDLYERLEDMGAGPATNLTCLHYALLPAIAPLDTAEGARELFARVDTVAENAAHVAVIIDTTSRATEGEENSADTIRAFYRHTGLGLKQRGCTWARLDHAGKNKEAGQRGSSAKGDDVDVVWKLDRTENGIVLVRDLSRMGWVPERTTFVRHEDPLRFVRVDEDWPAGTNEAADRLDRLDIDPELGHKKAGQMLRADGWRGSQNVVSAAQKWRRQRPEGRS